VNDDASVADYERRDGLVEWNNLDIINPATHGTLKSTTPNRLERISLGKPNQTV